LQVIAGEPVKDAASNNDTALPGYIMNYLGRKNDG
jgi:hypothetical protein